MTAQPGTRARRVAEGVRKEIAAIIIYEMKDPKVAGSVVTGVDMSNDLRTARVIVRCLEVADDPARRRDLIGALQRASGMLRREVTRRLRLRHAPVLRFVYDDGAEHTGRIEQLLDEIATERRSR